MQEGEITRVDATAPLRIDVRFIAATNRSRIQEVTDGRFREDLFYRLAVAVIPLPALRDRDQDAALLLDRLLDQVNRASPGEPGYETKKISISARKLLLDQGASDFFLAADLYHAHTVSFATAAALAGRGYEESATGSRSTSVTAS